MVEVEDDASTGDEILLITRRGRDFLVLRDKVTKRFIKFLKRISIAVTKTLDYDSPRSKQNNIYIDAKAITDITAEKFSERVDIVRELDSAIDEVVTQFFGETLGSMIEGETIGVEYSSEIEGMLYPNARVYLAWGRDHPVKGTSREVML
jgi:hypothetical protein